MWYSMNSSKGKLPGKEKTMFDIRILNGFEYGKKLYKLEGELYGYESCPYETDKRVES